MILAAMQTCWYTEMFSRGFQNWLLTTTTALKSSPGDHERMSRITAKI